MGSISSAHPRAKRLRESLGLKTGPLTANLPRTISKSYGLDNGKKANDGGMRLDPNPVWNLDSYFALCAGL